MRLGKFVEHFKAAALAADTKDMDPVLKYLAVGRQLGYAFYMTFDAMTYIDQVGIRKFEGAARLQKEAYRAWFAGLMCNIVAGAYQLYYMKADSRQTEVSADAEKTVELKKLARYVTSISCLIEFRLLILTTENDLLSSCSSSRISAMPLSQAVLLESPTSMMASLVWLERRVV